MKAHTWPALLATILLAAPCQAGTDPAKALRKAQAALAAGEYDSAYPQYLHFAEQENNHLAQFTLGMFHQLGWGERPVDREAACGWFERAAEGDIPAAAHFLGECFANGTGRPADPAAAAVWYQKAAGLGHHMSLCALADLYMQGNGVDKDPRKGLELCRQAAEKGATPAYLQVGRYLLEGDESIRDPGAAHTWLQEAARFSAEAQFYLGIMYRDGIGQTPSPEEARYWFEHAASGGYVPAYFQTARLYFEVSPDYSTRKPPADDLAKAYMWLSATQQGSKDPQELERSRSMLEQVRAIMPETWAPTLDARVNAHLVKHPVMP